MMARQLGFSPNDLSNALEQISLASNSSNKSMPLQSLQPQLQAMMNVQDPGSLTSAGLSQNDRVVQLFVMLLKEISDAQAAQPMRTSSDFPNPRSSLDSAFSVGSGVPGRGSMGSDRISLDSLANGQFPVLPGSALQDPRWGPLSWLNCQFWSAVISAGQNVYEAVKGIPLKIFLQWCCHWENFAVLLTPEDSITQPMRVRLVVMACLTSFSMTINREVLHLTVLCRTHSTCTMFPGTAADWTPTKCCWLQSSSSMHNPPEGIDHLIYQDSSLHSWYGWCQFSIENFGVLSSQSWIDNQDWIILTLWKCTVTYSLVLRPDSPLFCLYERNCLYWIFSQLWRLWILLFLTYCLAHAVIQESQPKALMSRHWFRGEALINRTCPLMVVWLALECHHKCIQATWTCWLKMLLAWTPLMV